MDKIAVTIITIIVLAAAIIFVWYSAASQTAINPTPFPEGIVLFYGQGCPHCEEVENFISQNNIDQKIEITRMEVWYNKNNAATLAKTAQKCGITTDTVGVPFLYDGQGHCYIGEVDVPNFLKQAAGIQ